MSEQENTPEENTFDEVQANFQKWFESVRNTTKQQLSEEKLNQRKEQARTLLQKIETGTKSTYRTLEEKSEPMRNDVSEKLSDMKKSLYNYINQSQDSDTRSA